MTARTYDLVVLGEINVDLILTGDAQPIWGQTEKLVDDAQLVPGGSSMIFASGAARLGLRTAYVGVVGDDAFGTFMLDSLAAAGVDTTHVIVDPNIRTGITVLLSRPDGDRALLTYLGSIAALRVEQIDRDLIAQSRFLHTGAYFLQHSLQPSLPELYRYARSVGTVTSLDTNWDPSEQWDSGIQAVLAETDVFLPNRAEACNITRVDDPGAALEQLARHIPTVGVKLGAEGGLAMQGTKRVAVLPPAMNPVDTTGAGDSFDAGFIAAIAKGLSLHDTIAVATACGSLSTRGIGGTATQATWDEAWAVASRLEATNSTR